MGIFNDVVFSSLIMVMVITSILCPYFLKVLLQKKKSDNSLERIPCVAGQKEQQPEKVMVD